MNRFIYISKRCKHLIAASFFLILRTVFKSLTYLGLLFYRKKRLTVFFDCYFCPASFDVLSFFTTAELKRQEKKCCEISVVFRYHPAVEFRNHSSLILDESWYRWRFNNIVMQAIHLFPHISSYKVFSSKWRALIQVLGARYIYPWHSLSFNHGRFCDVIRKAVVKLSPSFTGGITAPIAAKRYIKDWMESSVKDKKLITITLRYSPFTPIRNSKISEWAKFANSCDLEKYYLVFVMDTDTVLQGYPQALSTFPFFDAATWNLCMRAALYESAYLNLFSSGGPAFMCVYNPRTRFIYFKVSVDGEPSASDEVVYNECGWVRGKNMPWASPYQQIVWEDDDFPTIQREFNAMCVKMEQGSEVNTI